MYRRYFSETVIVGGVKMKKSVPPGGYLEHQIAYLRRKRKAGRSNSDSEDEETTELLTGIFSLQQPITRIFLTFDQNYLFYFEPHLKLQSRIS